MRFDIIIWIMFSFLSQNFVSFLLIIFPKIFPIYHYTIMSVFNVIIIKKTLENNPAFLINSLFQSNNTSPTTPSILRCIGIRFVMA